MTDVQMAVALFLIVVVSAIGWMAMHRDHAALRDDPTLDVQNHEGDE